MRRAVQDLQDSDLILYPKWLNVCKSGSSFEKLKIQMAIVANDDD